MSERVSSFFLTHRTILCSEGEAFGASCCPRGISRESGSRIGQAFEEEGKQIYSRAFLEEVWVRNCALLAVASNYDSYVHFVSEKGSTDHVRGPGQSCF